MYLFYALLLVIPMFFLRKRTAESGEILDAKSTTCLKGLLCFFVMLHNLGLDLPGNTVIKERICEYSGGIGVGRSSSCPRLGLFVPISVSGTDT